MTQIPGVGAIVHENRGTTVRGGLEITPPGTIPSYRAVDGHREVGMTGRLIVSCLSAPVGRLGRSRLVVLARFRA